MLDIGHDQRARSKQLEEHHKRSEMKIGQLRQYVNIERGFASVGDRGQSVLTWANVYEGIPAAVVPLTGREAETSRQLVATADYMVTMRFHPGIEVSDRIIAGDKTLEVGHIKDQDGRNLWLALTCTEVVE
jgi:head-tail adaptor